MDEITNIDLDSYTPNYKTTQLLKDVHILLLVGPTASGKDTLANELLKSGKYYQIVTYTTRVPRQNHGVLEVDGQDYNFISAAKAKEMLRKHQFIEAELIHHNLYGTSIQEFEKAKTKGKIAITDLGVKGVSSYMRFSEHAIAIYVLPPNMETLIKRLTKRYGHSNDDREVKTRLNTALKELKELLKRDYYYAVINDDLKTTVEIIKKLAETNTSDSQQEAQARQVAKDMIKDIGGYLTY